MNTRLSFIVPIVITLIGVVVGFATPIPEKDWLGMAVIVRIGGAICIACIAAIVLSATAFIRKEKRASISLFIALPACAFLLFGGTSFGKEWIRKNERTRLDDLRVQISDDPTMVKRLIREEPPNDAALKAILVSEQRHLLDAEDIQYLWNLRGTGVQVYPRFLIGAANTPATILREHYNEVLDAAEKREGKPSSQELRYHEDLLRHPNLPEDLIEEVKRYDIPSLTKALLLNPQLKSDDVSN